MFLRIVSMICLWICSILFLQNIVSMSCYCRVYELLFLLVIFFMSMNCFVPMNWCLWVVVSLWAAMSMNYRILELSCLKIILSMTSRVYDFSLPWYFVSERIGMSMIGRVYDLSYLWFVVSMICRVYDLLCLWFIVSMICW